MTLAAHQVGVVGARVRHLYAHHHGKFLAFSLVGAQKSILNTVLLVVAVDVLDLPAFVAAPAIIGATFVWSYWAMCRAGVIGAALVMLAPPAGAHEAQLSDGRVVDYAGLRSPAGSDCCGNRDCRMVEWREVESGHLEASIPGFGWVRMPREVMIPPHPDAPDMMHVCWDQTNTVVLNVRCWAPPGFGT